MFSNKNKKKKYNIQLYKPQFHCIKVGFKWGTFHGHVILMDFDLLHSDIGAKTTIISNYKVLDLHAIIIVKDNPFCSVKVQSLKSVAMVMQC